MMRIIALGHRKYTGKDTFGKFLNSELRQQHRGLDIQMVGFADALKDVCYRLYAWAGMKPKEFYEANPERKNDLLEPLGKTVRQVWIDVGNHMRQLDPLVWINAVGFRANIVIVKDLRFPNEANLIKQRGGHVIKIVRDAAPIDEDGADDPLATYEGWDHIVTNNGTLIELHAKAIKLIEFLHLGKK